MLVTIGDLVEDVVVELRGPINIASDTDARIHHRRGGSAANVAAAAAGIGWPARFVGQVGDDATGEQLVADLAAAGVDVRYVRRSGRTASIVVLVDSAGERTMLVDPGSTRDLDAPDPAWIDGASVVHLTLYSLLGGAIAATSRAIVEIAHARGVEVSVDVSSVALIESAGAATIRSLVESLRPSVVFANADEAALLELNGPVGEALVVVKRGGHPCTVYTPGGPPVDVPAIAIDAASDTTGAGDAFAAGVLSHPGWRSDLVAACRSGHQAAHALLTWRTKQNNSIVIRDT